ncbi:MAG: YggS family pyridoxal phosphate-dependent enzyme [Clostridiales bacterium]|nr:YggS family pyridoxal phosphate-dependent enzyme [Clostridiales bacterium]
MEYIRKNLEEIRRNIAEAALKSGRAPEDITLVGVTKTVEPEKIAALLDLGVKDLGENRVQELNEKMPLLTARAPRWHLIGNLQKNKIKYVIGRVAMIQSLESSALAEAVSAAAEKAGTRVDALIEINIAGEISKHGAAPSEALSIARGIEELPGLRLRGLMCVAPFVDNSEKNRFHFREMFQLYIDIRDKMRHNNIDTLSMGMSGDYAVAIEEGATMARVGTSLFGGRN